MAHLKIPNPCEASASDMSPTERGSFCAHCQKEVIDFTRMSDAEVLRFLKKQQGKTCGKVRKDQLNRVLATPAPTSRAAILAGLMGLLTPLAPQFAQAQVVEQQAIPVQESGDLRIFISHAQTGLPLKGASVKLEGNPQIFRSAEDGICIIPAKYLPKSSAISLVISHSTFTSQHIQLPQSRASNDVSIALVHPLPQISITGKVLDERGEAAAFSTVIVYEGELIRFGTQTDEEGNFKLGIGWDEQKIEKLQIEARQLGGITDRLQLRKDSTDNLVLKLPEGDIWMGAVIIVDEPSIQLNGTQGLIISRPSWKDPFEIRNP